MKFDVTCASCGTVFEAFKSEVTKGRKYCSYNCLAEARRKNGFIAEGKKQIGLTCRNCGNPFTMAASYLAAYKKKYDRCPPYCSTKCSSEGIRKDTEARATFTCLACGKITSNRRKPGGRIYAQQKFCDQACKVEGQRKRALAKFQRGEYGRHIKKTGYVWISVPSLVTGKKHGIMEHRYVMQQHLGRELLSEETVHHRDGNRQNNSLSNLQLFCKNHGPGQAVEDVIAWCITMFKRYPEFARAAGVELRDVTPATHTLTPVPLPA